MCLGDGRGPWRRGGFRNSLRHAGPRGPPISYLAQMNLRDLERGHLDPSAPDSLRRPASVCCGMKTRLRVGLGSGAKQTGASATGNILTVFLFWTLSDMQPSYPVFPKAPSVPISSRPQSPIQGPLAPTKPSLAKLSCRETRCCTGSRARIALDIPGGLPKALGLQKHGESGTVELSPKTCVVRSRALGVCKCRSYRKVP